MRRKDKSVEELAVKEAIIHKARVCRLGLCDKDQPYVVPLCFGYDNGIIYLHSAFAGRKIELLKRNNRVCVEFDLDGALTIDPIACKWSMHYQSVIVFGRAELVEDRDEKTKGLDLIMAHYHGNCPVYSEKALAATVVIKIAIDQMTCKMG
jgi:nitroimidazol reductase NimA-like FMN-containing flavoprotein (pyridoxamine 5'-phosphate oxidase superfamily)